MSGEVRSPRLGPALLAALLAAGPSLSGPVQAQIVTDGSVGPRASLSGPNIEIGADLGTRRDANLFHSFEKFGIATGQTATFTGPGEIKNVISRVTGGEISTIDGTLASRVGQADLYFLNPAGVVFGPNARLDVPGSLHVSTAHELRFADGARFSALDRTGSGLSVAPPEAFGFLAEAPQSIQVDRSQLRLTPGKVLSLVGGDLMIDGGQTGSVRTEDGVVQLVSAAAPGVVRIADAATMVGQRGEVRVTQLEDRFTPFGSIDVSGRNGGGTIRIRGGRVAVDGAWIFADNYGSRASTGGIDVQADALLIRHGLITAGTFGSGKAGMVTINADVLELHDGGQITSSTWRPGDAGRVTVTADRLLVTGSPSAIASSASPRSTGRGGTVVVTARELELRDGGQIDSSAQGSGDAGRVTVTADRLLVSGVRAARYTSGIYSSGSTGRGGTVAVTARELELHDGGQIGSGTFGSGDAGQVTVTADRLLVSGSSQISGSTILSSTGRGGTVVVTARELELRDGGQITSSTRGSGDAGQVAVTADRLLVSGSPSVIASTAQPGSAGQAGTVAVSARELELRDGGQISSATFGSGNAGQVTVTADRLLVSGDGAMYFTGIASSTEAGSIGDGGAVNIRAQNIVLRDRGGVATSSVGTGPGGPLSITAADTLRLDNATVQAQTASAGGGDVTVAAGRLFSLRNSEVTTSVAGETGSGGDITIGSPLMVLNDSRIEANAKQGAGGNITIRAGQLIRTPDSKITASGTVAGNIVITAPNTDVSSSLVVLPGTFLDAGSRLRETCAARGGRPASSLSPGGRGGLPPDPDAPLVASPFEPPLKPQVATGSPTALTARPTQAAEPVRVAGTPKPVLGAPRPACRG